MGAGAVDDAVPVEGGAGVGLVGLDMVVAEDAAVGFEGFVGKFARDELAGGVARIVAGDFGEHFAEGGGEFGEGGVLLRREIVLDEVGVLDRAAHGSGARGMADEILRVDHRVFDRGRDGDRGATGGVGLIPGVEDLHVAGRIGAHVGDLDADGAGVGGGGVESALFEVERLVNRAVDIQHEVNAEAAVIVEDVEAGFAQAADVVVHNELVDDVAQRGQIPAATADALQVFGGEGRIAAETVAGGGLEVLHRLFGFFKAAVVERGEAALGAVSVVALRVQPGDDAGAGVKELAGDDDLVARAFGGGAGAVEAAGREEERERGEERAEVGEAAEEGEMERGGNGEKGGARHGGKGERVSVVEQRVGAQSRNGRWRRAAAHLGLGQTLSGLGRSLRARRRAGRGVTR